jgi:murein DD-endopeptidase MepM/ murein hydrolase activator NlpD
MPRLTALSVALTALATAGCDVAAQPSAPRAATALPEERAEAARRGPEEAAAIDDATASSVSVEPALRVRRVDIVVGWRGIAAATTEAGLTSSVLDALDAALTTRLDVYALRAPATLTVWLDEPGDLVAVRVPLGSGRLFAARYDGGLAPAGFYDERGLSLAGPLRSRPVRLSHVTSRFGQRFDPITGVDDVHHGVDYAVPVGTEVFAAGDGRVKAVGTSESAGNFIKLAHAGGFESWYLHLDSFAAGTELGGLVRQGQLIARSGNTGRSTGPHVHYELHLAGVALDPERTMPIPETALGPLALREHRAFIQQLTAMEAMR